MNETSMSYLYGHYVGKRIISEKYGPGTIKGVSGGHFPTFEALFDNGKYVDFLLEHSFSLIEDEEE